MSRSAEPTTRRGEGLRWYVGAIPRWFLLDGSRRVVAGVILLAATVVFGLCIGFWARFLTAGRPFTR